MQKETRTENEYLEQLLAMEDLAEKKAKIYSRLLINPSLAGQMEGFAAEHAKRKEALTALLYGKSEKGKRKANEQGRYKTNEEEKAE